jgi:hypothetical protein
MVDMKNSPFSYIIPDEKTFFWKRVNIFEVDEIHEEISQHIKTIIPSEIDRAFYYIDANLLEENCSSLFNWIKKENLQISSTAMIIYLPTNNESNKTIPSGDIHTDRSHSSFFPNQLALNFPVISCIHPDVWTSMYRCEEKKFSDEKIEKKRVNFANKDSPEYRWLWCKEITRFQYIDKNPILFNAKIPHAVYNYSDEIRVTLSLRFSVDPIWWIK